ncbi:MAG: M23 family metallopeptidase [Alphaproteobacteria bacterium]|nr:M23 family metallopeptidase [Alphaproteobacteria bacterium]
MTAASGLRAGALVLALVVLAGCVPENYLRTRSQPAGAAPTAQEVVVRSGESLSVIAQRQGVSTRAMAEANNLRPPYVVRPGQRLTVPRGDAPRPAEPSAAARAASPPASGADAPPSAPSGDRVERQTLAPPSSAPPAARNGRTASPDPRSEPAPAAAAPASDDSGATPPRAGRLFAWPLQGNIVSDFGPKPGGLHNDGINIAAARNTPIRAAENGVVVYAGNELRGFGNLLLVRHADGWVTAYGHCEQLLVRRGAQVRRGQVIARVGSSGNVRTPQLHFEVRRGTRPVNPNEYLER